MFQCVQVEAMNEGFGWEEPVQRSQDPVNSRTLPNWSHGAGFQLDESNQGASTSIE